MLLKKMKEMSRMLSQGIKKNKEIKRVNNKMKIHVFEMMKKKMKKIIKMILLDKKAQL